MPLRYTLAALLLLTTPAAAQAPGSCDLGVATADLSLSDVRASVYNTGSLFYRGGAAGYEVPKDGGVHALFTASLWLGGEVDGELRTAWADFGDYEMWPGPLDDGAALPDPDDCSAYDRIYHASAPDLAAYDQTGVPSAELAAWPVGLGAPARDAQGDAVVPTSREQVIDLAAGERPVIFGTETLFWVMNDVGNVHSNSDTAPLGIEVRAMAFSVSSPGETALDQSTFYRYQVINRSAATIEDFRFGVMNYHDLGDSQDDYQGSDAGRSMLYTYNADDDDAVTEGGYGTAPPALGIDMLSGAAYGMKYAGNGNEVDGNPTNGVQAYNFLSGFWRNGQRWTRGFDATVESQSPTDWMYDGDPTAADAFWSQRDQDPAAGIQPGQPGSDQAGVLSAAPVDLAPGASHTVDVAVVFARGADHLDSVTELFAASDLVQTRYDDGSLFETVLVADEPSAPAAGIQLHAPLPNPSRGSASVGFTLDVPRAVRLRVVDALGRTVAVLADGERAAGPHRVALPRGLAPGVYAVTVEAGSERAVRTLTVVR